MDGVINVYKPAGWTSQDVCAKLRSRLHIKKIGHTGTLDPMATGVLPVCIGKATRIIEYYDRDRKAYHASMKLGITTDTLDITGEVIETNDYADVSEDAVRKAFEAYTGVVSQMPPKYSALKINGKRAYELAREGKDFELQAREIEIYCNRVTRLALGAGEIEFDVECSKGTYIRSMIADIGRSLGCGAVMTALERTASGCFKAEDSIAIDELVSIIDAALNSGNKNTVQNKNDETAQSSNSETANPSNDKTSKSLNKDIALKKLESIVLPADETLTNLGRIILNDNRVTAFSNGNSSHLAGCRIIEESHFDELYRVYARPNKNCDTADCNDSATADHNENEGSVPPSLGPLSFLGIGRIIEGELVPQKVFR